MPNTPQGFENRLHQLRGELVAQGRRVQQLLEASFDAFFSREENRARAVEGFDDDVDRADVEIEKSAVALLTDATHENAKLEPTQLRAVLTIVKINNELERIADSGVEIARRGMALKKESTVIPETFRVMGNSTIGLVRDAVKAYERSDAVLAKVVLQSEDAIEAFKQAILKDAERKIAEGKMSVDFAFTLHEVAAECLIIGDHCTNMSEQVIYSVTGAIVRHMESGWVELPRIA
jgi:phosphate transport system protein